MAVHPVIRDLSYILNYLGYEYTYNSESINVWFQDGCNDWIHINNGKLHWDLELFIDKKRNVLWNYFEFTLPYVY